MTRSTARPGGLKAAHSVDELMKLGYARMDDSVTKEQAAALIEITKTANHRFEDLVADANPIATARTRRFDSVAGPEGVA